MARHVFISPNHCSRCVRRLAQQQSESVTCLACGRPTARITVDKQSIEGMHLPGGYVVDRWIADGGMGSVYRGRQLRLDRQVALKMLKPHLLGDVRARKKFVEEVRLSSSISHPHAVRVFDFVVTEGGLPFLVLEWLQGEHLGALLHRVGTLPWRRSVLISLQILDALDAAHGQNIIHLDINPNNVMLCDERQPGTDRIKVLDFGLARLIDEAEKMYGNELPAGTPDYMAPEVAMSGQPTFASDMFAVGVLLFRMLTGRLPYAGSTAEARLINKFVDEPHSTRDFEMEHSSPEALEAIVAQAITRSPERRYQTAAAFAQDLRHLLGTGRAKIPRPRRCPACAAQTKEQDRFCGSCGHHLGT